MVPCDSIAQSVYEDEDHFRFLDKVVAQPFCYFKEKQKATTTKCAYKITQRGGEKIFLDHVYAKLNWGQSCFHNTFLQVSNSFNYRLPPPPKFHIEKLKYK